ncbi:MAG: type II toxin-antitoxin system PrlF family antitoxin [Deltaproteobacteria bacterium]|nr:type II toxin-antitoxin system PrlF family antitoxin [Deltaproteobacteria bacterium]
MPTSVLTSKGQTTIPKDVRKLLKIETGDRIDFIIKEDGSVMLKPAMISVRELKGILKPFSKKSVTIEAMNQAVKSRFKRKL